MRRTDTAGKLSQVLAPPSGIRIRVPGSAPTRRTESTVRLAHGEHPRVSELRISFSHFCPDISGEQLLYHGFLCKSSCFWLPWNPFPPMSYHHLSVSEDRKPPSSLCFSSSSVRSTEWVQLRHFSVVWWVCQSLTPDNFPQGL